MADLAKVIDLYVDTNGQVRRILVDGIDIGGWLSGSTVKVVSDAEVETGIEVRLTAPTINYLPLV